ncbi:hypothetical protein [Aeromonas phage AS-yj]|nr:hypothetical protein HWB29_gp391 [Aeromonas phage AS-sw]ATI17907.1 hypothetical protein [Aeromonas phage AS-yj]ATI18441.1 hypothetical protein [Aeromonas phage AS-sw]
MISETLKKKIISYYNERVKFAREYYKDHKLLRFNVVNSYSLRFTNHKSYVGQCNGKDRTIDLSLYYLRYMTWDGIADVINHELAHWIDDRDVHGAYWKAAAVVMGANPTRLVQHDHMSRPWLIMFGDEIVGTSEEDIKDIGGRYIRRRKKETLGNLTCVPNPDSIDNSIYGE